MGQIAPFMDHTVVFSLGMKLFKFFSVRIVVLWSEKICLLLGLFPAILNGVKDFPSSIRRLSMWGMVSLQTIHSARAERAPPPALCQVYGPPFTFSVIPFT